MFKNLCLSFLIFVSSSVSALNLSFLPYVGGQLSYSSGREFFKRVAIEPGLFVGFNVNNHVGIEASYQTILSQETLGVTTLNNFNIHVLGYMPFFDTIGKIFAGGGVTLLHKPCDTAIAPSLVVGGLYPIYSNVDVRVRADWKGFKSKPSNYDNIIGVGIGIVYKF